MQPLLKPRYSLVIPVYRNAESIADLLAAVDRLGRELGSQLETIFVVDGSPDASYALLHDALPGVVFPSKLVSLSRNFGSFAAIREGLRHARGEYVAVMAADLQEPPELVARFFGVLGQGDVDVVFGIREARDDPWASRLASGVFWGLYRRFVQSEVPPGGVDVFAVNRVFLERLVSFEEANGSLLGLLFWMGGRRRFLPYVRQRRQHGKSAWTFRKKWNYLLDSVFAFTDAPIRLLLLAGVVGLGISAALGLTVLVARLADLVVVPGYAGTMLAVLFFGGLNALGLGLVGNYAWRAYENTKRRPLSIPMLVEDFPPPATATEQDT
ncbi:glycosyltransferase family 2 protein [Luteimonas notoginsengisoli]|jgi:glycosyltransferase involved in cell wall biosynthesis|uniref:Glycosyltransferase family 2 protein n=1 Tax=Luteimonas notoginsengisoli TaxID=1578200 RepID=A0ABV7UNV6_9GAMM